MATRNHEIHTKQCKEGEHIELALLYKVLVAAQPLVCHKEHNDGTHIEHTLHNGHHGSVLVHAAKGTRRLGTAARQQVEQGVHGEQYYG